MPNLVGIGNSQAPTNAMLGGLAYQDSVGEIHIEKIKARTSDTATDIFVYDTRKDSDGGAWRHRTQKTSWYNEGVSATRGARKEFPAVAVIVAKTDTLIIYDGDDPNLPMWMVFEANTDSQDLFINDSSSTLTSIAALNGRIFVGSTRTSTTGNVTGIDFIGDRGGMVYTSSSDIRTYGGGVGERNDGLGNYASTSNWFTRGTIVNRDVHALAMTVLPNAPIDAISGLPIPTIAVATQGGMSVINDNGLVADLTGFNPVTFVAIEGDVIVGALGGTSTHDFIFKTNIPAGDEQFDVQITAGSGNYYMNSNSGTTPLVRDLNMTAMAFNPSDTTIYRGGNNGFDIITKTETLSGSSNISLISHVDTDYNSGYMVGDIKGAFLSSTNTTNLTDTQAVTNPGPFTNTTGWAAANAGWSISDSNNRLVINSGSQTSSYFGASQTLTLVDGRKYVLVVNIHSQTKTAVIRLTADGNYFTETGLGTGEHSFYFTANQASHSIFIGSDTGGTNREQQVSSVTIREVEEDRSVNDKGLEVHGTITKSAVASGAELVSYGSFSTSNRLRQPYNSDLNFGTNDFSIMFWVNHDGTDAHQTIVGRDEREFNIFILNNSSYNRRIRVYAHDSSDSVQHIDSTDDPFPMGVWNHVCVNYTGGNTATIYINGVFDNDGDLDYNINNTTYPLYVGVRNDSTDSNVSFPAVNCKIALLRISKSAPSAEQVKKIYEDERCLYRENAKCTISGATSAVTALGFDDSTDTAYVGTASGRSDFHGLNRINSTTTAVTTKISASNGLVAEQ